MNRQSAALPFKGSDRPNPAVSATVEIHRPVAEVFAFYRDFTHVPRFIGDVVAVEITGPNTSRWTVTGPLGLRLYMNMTVTEVRPNQMIRFHSGGWLGLGAEWEVRFSQAPRGGTKVEEVLHVPLGAISRVGLALIGKFPAAEVRANLQRLKQLLEAGDR